jgi:hypothetical protein
MWRASKRNYAYIERKRKRKRKRKKESRTPKLIATHRDPQTIAPAGGCRKKKVTF